LRIHPDRQTLILAGEAAPRRSVAASSAQRVTVISARVDAVVTQTDYRPDTSGAAYDPIDDADFKDLSLPTLPATSGKPSSAVTRPAYSANAPSAYTASAYGFTSRATALGGASAYARTQDLSERHPIIDTYA